MFKKLETALFILAIFGMLGLYCASLLILNSRFEKRQALEIAAMKTCYTKQSGNKR